LSWQFSAHWPIASSFGPPSVSGIAFVSVASNREEIALSYLEFKTAHYREMQGGFTIPQACTKPSEENGFRVTVARLCPALQHPLGGSRWCSGFAPVAGGKKLANGLA